MKHTETGLRKEVADLVALGRLPSEDDPASAFEKFEAALKTISRPVTSSEAEQLIQVFPDSDESAYGLAWTLLHLIETARVVPLPSSRPSGHWPRYLWDRSHRSNP
jgi:hypothetical protein